MNVETVTSEPAVRALTTVQAVRDYVGGIDAADTAAGSVLTNFILAASSRVRVDLGYRPWRTRYEYRTRTMTEQISIALPSPVGIHVYAVTDQDGTDYETRITIADYGAVYFDPALPARTYIVDYEAGWPVGPAAVQVPPDLQQGVIEMVAQAWHARGRSPDVASEDLDGVASLNFEPRRMPFDAHATLDAVVGKAYGWGAQMSEEAALRALMGLSLAKGT